MKKICIKYDSARHHFHWRFPIHSRPAVNVSLSIIQPFPKHHIMISCLLLKLNSIFETIVHFHVNSLQTTDNVSSQMWM